MGCIKLSYFAEKNSTLKVVYGGRFVGGKSGLGAYRYGFNGKEKDTDGEWGELIHYDYGFRIYNPGIGKFLSVDPLTSSYPELTPYQFASNTPIAAIDLDGLEAMFYLSPEAATGLAQAGKELITNVKNADYVTDATVTRTVMSMKLNVAATVGKSTVYAGSGKVGHFSHFGVVLSFGKGGVPAKLGETYSVGVINGLANDINNYAGFFIGLGGNVDGIGLNHSGWLRLKQDKDLKIVKDGYTGATSISLDPINAIAALGGAHSLGVSLNFDFYSDDSKDALTQFEEQVRKTSSLWDDALKNVPSDVRDAFLNNLDEIHSIIRESIKNKTRSYDNVPTPPSGGGGRDEYLGQDFLNQH